MHKLTSPAHLVIVSKQTNHKNTITVQKWTIKVSNDYTISIINPKWTGIIKSTVMQKIWTRKMYSIDRNKQYAHMI